MAEKYYAYHQEVDSKQTESILADPEKPNEHHDVLKSAMLYDRSKGYYTPLGNGQTNWSKEVEQFLALSEQEQVKYVQTHHVYLDSQVVHDESYWIKHNRDKELLDQLSPAVQNAWHDKLVANADFLAITSAPPTARMQWTWEELLPHLSSDVLGAVAFNRGYYGNHDVVRELKTRIDQGQLVDLFNQKTDKNLFLLDHEMAKKLDQFCQETALPAVLALVVQLDLDETTTTQLTEAINTGVLLNKTDIVSLYATTQDGLSSEAGQLLRQFWQDKSNWRKSKDIDYRLLQADIVKSLSPELISQLCWNLQISEKVYLLWKHQPSIFALLTRLTDYYRQDNSLGNLVDNFQSVLNVLFTNQEAFVTFDDSHVDLVQLSEYLQSDLKHDFLSTTRQQQDQMCDDQREKLMTQYLQEKAEFQQTAQSTEKDDKREWRWQRDVEMPTLGHLRRLYSTKFFGNDHFLADATKFTSTMLRYMDDLLSTMPDDDPRKIDFYRAQVVGEFAQTVMQMDLDSLNQLYDAQTFRFSNEELRVLSKAIREAYNQTYIDTIQHSKEFFLRDCPFHYEPVIDSRGNPKQIKVIDITDGPWGLLMHSTDTGYAERKKVFNDGYDVNWRAIDRDKNHLLSTFYASDEVFSPPPVKGDGVLAVFWDLSPEQILMMSNHDLYTDNDATGLKADSPEQLMTPSKMAVHTATDTKFVSNWSGDGYDEVVEEINEVVLTAKGLTPTAFYFHSYSEPSYYNTMETENLKEIEKHFYQCALKAAADWSENGREIPVLYDHGRSQLQRLEQAYQALVRYQQDTDANELLHALRLYTPIKNLLSSEDTQVKLENQADLWLWIDKIETIIQTLVAQIKTPNFDLVQLEQLYNAEKKAQLVVPDFTVNSRFDGLQVVFTNKSALEKYKKNRNESNDILAEWSTVVQAKYIMLQTTNQKSLTYATLKYLLTDNMDFTIDDILSKSPAYTLISYLDEWLQYGVTVEQIMPHIRKRVQKSDDRLPAYSWRELLSHASATTVNEILALAKEKLSNEEYHHIVLANLALLHQTQADINLNDLVASLKPKEILEHYDDLIAAGVKVNVDPKEVLRLPPDELIAACPALKKIEPTFDITAEFEHVDSSVLLANLDQLDKVGVSADTVITTIIKQKKYVREYELAKDLAKLSTHGASREMLWAYCDHGLTRYGKPEYVSRDVVQFLLDHEFGIDQVLGLLSPTSMVENLDLIMPLKPDLDVSNVIKNVEPLTIIENFDQLTAAEVEVDINNLVSQMSAEIIMKHLDLLHQQQVGLETVIAALKSQMNKRAEYTTNAKLVAAKLSAFAIYGDELDLTQIAQLFTNYGKEALKRSDQFIRLGFSVEQLTQLFGVELLSADLGEIDDDNFDFLPYFIDTYHADKDQLAAIFTRNIVAIKGKGGGF